MTTQERRPAQGSALRAQMVPDAGAARPVLIDALADQVVSALRTENAALHRSLTVSRDVAEELVLELRRTHLVLLALVACVPVRGTRPPVPASATCRCGVVFAPTDLLNTRCPACQRRPPHKFVCDRCGKRSTSVKPETTCGACRRAAAAGGGAVNPSNNTKGARV